MVYIEDEIHCELDGPFGGFEEAVAELRRRAGMAWDVAPNQAPCVSWRSCGRAYCVIEYDALRETATVLRRVHVLDVSVKGIVWVEGFERAWAAGAVRL